MRTEDKLNRIEEYVAYLSDCVNGLIGTYSNINGAKFSKYIISDSKKYSTEIPHIISIYTKYDKIFDIEVSHIEDVAEYINEIVLNGYYSDEENVYYFPDAISKIICKKKT